ncbi:unnamed protein product [Larinioides sclopetarius]|uniref:Uncharacterized protein n=1 Tax=Larinioides sclopetarius TaxID=280406 RepID=A0AAV2A5G3_9ARAC
MQIVLRRWVWAGLRQIDPVYQPITESRPVTWRHSALAICVEPTECGLVLVVLFVGGAVCLRRCEFRRSEDFSCPADKNVRLLWRALDCLADFDVVLRVGLLILKNGINSLGFRLHSQVNKSKDSLVYVDYLCY